MIIFFYKPEKCIFPNRKQDLENQDRSGNEDSGDMSEEEEEEEVGDPSSN